MNIGSAFHAGYDGEETVIFGHCATSRLREDGQPLPYVGPNRIVGLDTSEAGRLTAYRWPDGAVLQEP